jgi:hypothetical protein
MIPLKIRATSPRRVFGPTPRRVHEQAAQHDVLRPI